MGLEPGPDCLLLVAPETSHYGGSRLRLEYRFEVAAIGVTWLVLIAAPVLLSIALVRTRPLDDDQAARDGMSRS
jgi:hypothetical protein